MRSTHALITPPTTADRIQSIWITPGNISNQISMSSRSCAIITITQIEIRRVMKSKTFFNDCFFIVFLAFPSFLVCTIFFEFIHSVTPFYRDFPILCILYHIICKKANLVKKLCKVKVGRCAPFFFGNNY